MDPKKEEQAKIENEIVGRSHAQRLLVLELQKLEEKLKERERDDSV